MFCHQFGQYKAVSFTMRLEGSANFKRGKEPGNWTQKHNKIKREPL